MEKRRKGRKDIGRKVYTAETSGAVMDLVSVWVLREAAGGSTVHGTWAWSEFPTLVHIY